MDKANGGVTLIARQIKIGQSAVVQGSGVSASPLLHSSQQDSLASLKNAAAKELDKAVNIETPVIKRIIEIILVIFTHLK